MSQYYKLINEDKLLMIEDDRAYVFNSAAEEWTRQSENRLAGVTNVNDMVAAAVPISENEAREWIARKADGAE